MLYMMSDDLNGQFFAEKMGYHEMVLLRPQGAAEVVVHWRGLPTLIIMRFHPLRQLIGGVLLYR